METPWSLQGLYGEVEYSDKTKSLYDFTYDQMGDIALEQGWKKFHAHQIFQWLYYKRAVDTDDMSDLSKDTRETLKQQFSLTPLKLRDKQVASDRATKYLFTLESGSLTEGVLMQFNYGKSICVTSQVGCNIACVFCASGLIKKKRNLTSGEMMAQVLHMQRDLDKREDRLSHIVVTGTGEPFDNYEHMMNFPSTINHDHELGVGAHHITISTCGVIPKIYEFVKEHTQYNLAISLHAPNNELRNHLTSVSRAYPLEGLVEAVQCYARESNRRLTLEYILLHGVNDQKEHVAQLAKLLKDLNTYVNLAPYNTVDENGLREVDHAHAMVFYGAFMEQGVRYTIRKEHGADVDAAYGQLRVKHLKKEQEGSHSRVFNIMERVVLDFEEEIIRAASVFWETESMLCQSQPMTALVAVLQKML